MTTRRILSQNKNLVLVSNDIMLGLAPMKNIIDKDHMGHC